MRCFRSPEQESKLLQEGGTHPCPEDGTTWVRHRAFQSSTCPEPLLCKATLFPSFVIACSQCGLLGFPGPAQDSCPGCVAGATCKGSLVPAIWNLRDHTGLKLVCHHPQSQPPLRTRTESRHSHVRARPAPGLPTR